jgi:transposase-like protein
MGKAKVTHEERQRAIEAVQRGKPRREVAKQYKVSLHTVHAWMSQARGSSRQGEADVDLARRVDRLEAKVELLEKLIIKQR